MRILIYVVFIHYVFGLFIPIHKRGATNHIKSQNNKIGAKEKLCEQLGILIKYLPDGMNKNTFQKNINSIKNGESYATAIDNIVNNLEKFSISDKLNSNRAAIKKCLGDARDQVKLIANQRRTDFIRHNKDKDINEDSSIGELIQVANKRFNSIKITNTVTGKETTIGNIGEVSSNDIINLSKITNSNKNFDFVTINKNEYKVCGKVNAKAINAKTHIKPIESCEKLRDAIKALYDKVSGSCNFTNHNSNNNTKTNQFDRG